MEHRLPLRVYILIKPHRATDQLRLCAQWQVALLFMHTHKERENSSYITHAREAAGGEEGWGGSKGAGDVGDSRAPGLVFLIRAAHTSNRLVYHSHEGNAAVLVTPVLFCICGSDTQTQECVLPRRAKSHNLFLINVHKRAGTHSRTHNLAERNRIRSGSVPQKSEPEPNNQLSFPRRTHGQLLPPATLPPPRPPGDWQRNRRSD